MPPALAALLSTLLAAVAPPATPADAATTTELQTPAERQGFRATPSYAETIAFLEQLERRFPQIQLGYFGTSAAGRRLPLVVVSNENAFVAKRAKRTRKPIVMVQSGIHAGEIDGKDATLMLLRDLALGRHRQLLDGVVLLFVPIYNVDGHERVSPFNRPNQVGPEAGMGFRTTANGLDLNRDHLKLVSPEARQLLALVTSWEPHLHVDVHVTNGVEHGWRLTWAWAEAPLAAPSIDRWLGAHMPRVLAAASAAGHPNGPYVELVDDADPSKGFTSSVHEPRYSTGYFPLRNRPSLLVETNAHVPYAERVRATYDFLLALLAEVAREPAGLVEAVRLADERTVALGRPDAAPSAMVIAWKEGTADRATLPLAPWASATSMVTGQPSLTYSGAPRDLELPWYHRVEPAKSAPRPRGYLVLPGWIQIEQRLRDHGLRAARLRRSTTVEVETLWLDDPRFETPTYQGLTRTTAGVRAQRERREVPEGALWIPADQPLFELAVQLLEPEAPDSLFAWGLLSSLFERKEYISVPRLEGLARDLLADPRVAGEWEAALREPAFAQDTKARYLWWYRRTPYWDETVGLHPVLRVPAAPALDTYPWN